MLRHAFAAMGTEVELLLDSGERSLLDDAEREVRRLEGLLSRFRTNSELFRLNETGELNAGAELLELTRLAIEARERTAGRYDPTVHEAVVAAGYDRSFELLTQDGQRAPAVATHVGGRVEVDEASGRITLEPGSKLDFGGIAKGWVADRIAAQLVTAGPILVNAGGDIAVRGAAEWPIAVEAAADSVTLALRECGLATSGRDRRMWTRNGRRHHHIVDPATGLPAETDVLAITVVARSATAAEVLATSLFLAGCHERTLEEADAAGVSAVVVTSDGRAHLTEALR